MSTNRPTATPIEKSWEKGRYDYEKAGTRPEVMKRKTYLRDWKG